MKKIAILFALILLCLPMLCSCAGGGKLDPEVLKPSSTKLQSICNLATLECYYHNVAKSESQGLWNIDATKKKFWIEYTGTVKIGIDFSEVRMEIKDADVSISIPQAKVLSINVDEASLNAENAYYTEKANLLKGKISAEEQTAAIKAAQEQMTEAAKTNSSLLATAQSRAETMIENYINQLGELSGTQYNIKWIALTESEE